MLATASPFRIVVVGAGFAGTATAAQLLRDWSGRPLSLTLLERSGSVGPGVAFSTPDEQHLLNVDAAGMSALPGAPTDFVDWLRAQDGAASGCAATRSSTAPDPTPRPAPTAIRCCRG